MTNHPHLLVDDEVTRALLPRYERAAELVKNAIEAHRPILVRFDGDGDGISSAMIMMEAIEGLGHQHKYPLKLLRSAQAESAIYRLEEAQLEVGNFASSEHKPFVVLLDQGGNVDSIPSLKLLKDAGFNTIILDHHPTQAKDIEPVVDVLVNPWTVAGKGIEYPTALHAYEVARRVWPKQGDKVEYAQWGLQADKSIFATKTELKEPIVLDYLATYNDAAGSLPKYRRVMGNPAEVERVFAEADDKLKEGLAKAIEKAKVREFPRMALALIKLKVLRSRWPSKSKLMNVTHTHFAQQLDRALVSIGYAGDKILLRANHKAFQAGFRANHFISTLKQEMPDSIESGGGHDVAAAMKVNPAHLKPLVARLTELIEREFS